jgi:hypothetical protein
MIINDLNQRQIKLDQSSNQNTKQYKNQKI